MITPYSKIVNAQVLELRNQTRIGVVGEVVIKKSDLSLGGLLIKKSPLNLMSKQKAVNSLDIVEISNDFIILNKAESVISLDEAIRIKEAVEAGFGGIGQKVVTKSGKHIGRVFDYLVVSPGYKISKFYVKSLLTERIIAGTSVVKFDGKKLIVQDEYELTKATSPLPEAEMV